MIPMFALNLNISVQEARGVVNISSASWYIFGVETCDKQIMMPVYEVGLEVMFLQVQF